MRYGMKRCLAAISMTTLPLVACASPAPPPPAPPPLPPVATASAAPPPADTTPPPPPKPTLAELIPPALKGLSEAFNAHDGKVIASYFTADAVTDAYGEPTAHGRDDLTRAMDGLFATFGDSRSVPTRVWIKGNVVVVETVWTGTMTGDFMGMKATKKPVGEYRVDVMQFNDDGLVKEMHEYGDDAGLMAQMTGKKGAPPVPPLPTNMPELHVSKGTPDEDKLADWAKASDETFSKGDVKAAIAMNADDGDYWVNFTGMPATKGKKDLSKDLEGFFKAFPDQKWATVNAWGIDGFAIVEHTMTGTQKGKLGPVPASNKEVRDWHWLDIMQPTADGKLQHGWGYANLVEALAQTGALKTPGDKPAASPKPAAAAPKPDPAAMEAKAPASPDTPKK
ncbi:MAG TPA: ester cyclase [Polyangiaceae bacterium]|nr:ester cyclase [Polyangiaceae bacterium]